MLTTAQKRIILPRRFTPASLFPNAWFEPRRGGLFQSSAIATPAVAIGDVVGFLPDQSGNAFNLASAADDTTRPTLQGVGAFPYLSFDGSNDVLLRTASTLNSYNSASGFTWAVVFRSNSNAVGTRVFAEGDNAASNANTIMSPLEATPATATSSRAFYRNDTGVSPGTGSPSSTTDTPLNANVFNGSDHVFIYTDDGTSVSSVSNIATYVDGVAGATLSFTRNGSALIATRFGLGALVRNTTASWWAGRIYAVVCLNRVITSTERAKLTTYLGSLAGLSL